jgi:hypothetical protein
MLQLHRACEVVKLKGKGQQPPEPIEVSVQIGIRFKCCRPLLVLALPFYYSVSTPYVLLLSLSVVSRPSSQFAGQASPAPLLLPRQTPFAIPPPHPHPHPHPHQQPSLRVAANHNLPSTIQPNRFAAHAPERRDLASAQAKPAILGPEIGLEVRSILEHLLHATPPLNTHYLPALPPSLPMTTTPNLDLHDIPSNIRVTNRTHKSTTH